MKINTLEIDIREQPWKPGFEVSYEIVLTFGGYIVKTWTVTEDKFYVDEHIEDSAAEFVAGKLAELFDDD